MKYRFVLDDTIINENPVGWDDMRLNIKRDNDLKGLFVALDAKLTFSRDGYDFFKAIYDDPDYCAETRISIQRSIDDGQNYIERYKGLIFLSDIEFDDFKCSVTVNVTDDSFYGRINNRRANQAFLTGNKTINGEDLTPTPIYSMELFDPSDGSALALVQPRGIFRVYDVLEYLISFMTDNQVTFDSPLFGDSGDFAYLGLTFGYSIRETGNNVSVTEGDFASNMPPITFEEIFKELDHRFNLGMFVDTSGLKPKIVIDYWRNLFLGNELTTFPDLPNLKTKIAKELIYSKVRFAGAPTFDEPAASFPGGTRFIGFAKEEYSITGKCNVDTTLDLTYDFINDTNAIEQISVLSGTDDTWDDNWFLIDCYTHTVGQMTAKQSNWLEPGATERFYNEQLTNYEISRRYFGFVPNDIAAYLASVDNTFMATKTSDQAPTFGGSEPSGRTRINFQDETTPPNRDPGGNYNPATARYTAPNSGVYSFDIFIKEFYTPLVGNAYDTGYWLERYDSGGTFISEVFLGTIGVFYGNATATFRASTHMIATDYVLVTFREMASFGNVIVNAESTFACTATVDGGGVYQTYNPQDYPIHVSEFKTEIKQSQVDAIIADPLSKIRYYVSQLDSRIGWIDELNINEFEGTITAKILRSRTEEPKQLPPDIRMVHFTGQLHDNTFTLSIADEFGNPSGGAGTTNKIYFFNAGKELTVTIPAVFDGCAVNPVVNIYVVEFPDSGGSVPLPLFLTPTATFTINPNCNYIVLFNYVMNTPGNTFPTVTPEITAPLTAGANGSANIRLVSPSTNPADWAFLWSTGATTQSIIAPAGDYWCDVTNVNPGTFDTNTIRFNIQIPISEIGE